jgi:hypothetical protein
VPKSILSDEKALTNKVPCQISDSIFRSQGVPRLIAEAAFVEYDQHFGGQTFEQLHERGGFGTLEIMCLLYDRIKRLEEE